MQLITGPPSSPLIAIAPKFGNDPAIRGSPTTHQKFGGRTVHLILLRYAGFQNGLGFQPRGGGSLENM
jgi:hypothetical protein